MDDFLKIVLSPIPTIVLFGADWCGPCVKFKTHFKNAVEKNPFACFVEVDVDDDDGAEISAHYNISALPCLKVFKNGKVLCSFAGKICNAQTLADVVQKHGNTNLELDVTSDDEF